MKKNQKGFSTTIILLVVIIAGLVGTTGWLVYKNRHKTPSNSSTGTTSQPNSATTKTNTQYTNFVNSIQDDDSVIQISPDKIGKTADQIAILVALHNKCHDASLDYVTVNHIVFDGNTNFRQNGNYAVINATACTNIAKSLNDLDGSGAENYLHKNNSGMWIFDTASQTSPDCTKVDGLGYPSSLISTCYDNSTARAPR